MEKGAKALAILLLLAFALGVVILLVNPDYRQAAIAVWKGEPDKSPIWISNIEFYPDVTLKTEQVRDDQE